MYTRSSPVQLLYMNTDTCNVFLSFSLHISMTMAASVLCKQYLYITTLLSLSPSPPSISIIAPSPQDSVLCAKTKLLFNDCVTHIHREGAAGYGLLYNPNSEFPLEEIGINKLKIGDWLLCTTAQDSVCSGPRVCSVLGTYTSSWKCNAYFCTQEQSWTLGPCTWKLLDEERE